MRLRLVVSLCVTALFAACNDGATPCARVTCDPGYTCNAKNGVCEVSTTGGGGGGGGGGGDGGQTGGGGGGTAMCNPACTSPQVCDPSSNTCVDCVTSADCACPTPVCTASHLCTGGSDGGFVQPAGESCLSPATLIFPDCGTTAQFEVDLSTMTDDESGSCTGAMGLGKDAVYGIVLKEPHDLTVSVTPASGVQAVAYLRADPCSSGHELSCVNTFAQPKTFRLKGLDAGTWWLVIDSYSAATAGSVDVQVDLSDPTGPSNETCGTALPLEFDGGVATAQVDLTTADNDYAGSCNPNPAPEAVYSVSLAAPADLHFTATPAGGGFGLAVLYVQSTPCGTGEELTCSAPANGLASVRVRAAPAGDYYVFVEAADEFSTGVFDVTATASAASPPPDNDTCAAPRPLAAPIDSTPVPISIDTSVDTDNYTGSCNPTGKSPEEVFQLHVALAGNYTFQVSPSPGSSTVPVVYLRTAPCDFPSVVVPPADSGMTADGGIELLCTGSSKTTYLTPGDYFLYLEGVGLGGSGPTDLQISLQ